MAADRRTALHLTTRVGPGHEVEITAPELAEVETVEVFLVTTRSTENAVRKRPMIEILGSMPPGPRSAHSWEEFERQFQEERHSWGRGRPNLTIGSRRVPEAQSD